MIDNPETQATLGARHGTKPRKIKKKKHNTGN